MPTNPLPPHANASVDRLSLGVARARESDVASSGPFPCGSMCGCFESEASGMGFCSWQGMCFEAMTSTAPCSYSICACAEMEN